MNNEVDIILKKRNAKTHKGRKIIESHLPQFVEGSRKLLSIFNLKSSLVNKKFSGFLKLILNENYITIQKKLNILPFKDLEKLIKLSEKHLCPFIILFSNNKKRPNNFILSRVYNSSFTEQYEFGIEKFEELKNEIDNKLFNDSFLNTKPVCIINGDIFELSDEMKRLRHLFSDLINGGNNLEDLYDHNNNLGKLIISINGFENNKIKIRLYKENNGKLVGILYKINLILRRKELIPQSDFNTILKEKKNSTKIKKVKNIEKDLLGEKMGRVHVQQQKLSQLRLKKIRKKSKFPKDEEEFENKNVDNLNNI